MICVRIRVWEALPGEPQRPPSWCVGRWTIANKNQPLSSGSWVFCYLQPAVFLVDVSAWKLNRLMWKTTLTYPRALWMKKGQLLSFLTGKETTPVLFPSVRQLMTWVNPRPGHWSGVLCLTVTLLDALPLSPLHRALLPLGQAWPSFHLPWAQVSMQLYPTCLTLYHWPFSSL